MRFMWFLIVVLLSLSGCSTPSLHPPVDDVPDSDTSAPASAPLAIYAAESDLLYQVLLAEIAAQRNDFQTAFSSYMVASELSGDPRFAARAARIGAFTGEWDRVLRAGEWWLALEPGSRKARYILAAAYMELQDEATALQQLVSVVAAHADVEEGIDAAYSVLQQASDKELARQLAVQLARQFPQSVGAQFNVARLSSRVGDQASTTRALEATLRLQPRHVQATLLRAQMQLDAGFAARALGMVSGLLQQMPNNLVLNMGYARLLVQAGQGGGEEASQAMARTYSLAPENADVVQNLGLLALKAGQPTVAKGYFEHLLPLGQHTSKANYYLGRIAESEGRHEAAISYYSAVNSGKLQIDSQTRIAELLAALGEVAQARQRLQQLRGMDLSEEYMATFLLAEARILRNVERDREAFALLGEALKRYPENVDILYTQALIAYRVGYIDTFEQHLRRVLQLEPNNASALNALGYFLTKRPQDLDEAERYIRQAFAIDPGDPAIIDSLGWVYYLRGEHAEAVKLLRRAYGLFFDPEIAAHLGEVLWVSGDRQEAVRVWQGALEKSPQSDLLKEVIERFRE